MQTYTNSEQKHRLMETYTDTKTVANMHSLLGDTLSAILNFYHPVSFLNSGTQTEANMCSLWTDNQTETNMQSLSTDIQTDANRNSICDTQTETNRHSICNTQTEA